MSKARVDVLVVEARCPARQVDIRDRDQREACATGCSAISPARSVGTARNGTRVPSAATMGAALTSRRAERRTEDPHRETKHRLEHHRAPPSEDAHTKMISAAIASSPSFPPSGTATQGAPPLQSALVLHSERFGDEHALAHTTFAVTSVEVPPGGPLGRDVENTGRNVPQHTSPGLQRSGSQHSNCTELAHAARSMQVPDSPETQHVWPTAQGNAPNGEQ